MDQAGGRVSPPGHSSPPCPEAGVAMFAVARPRAALHTRALLVGLALSVLVSVAGTVRPAAAATGDVGYRAFSYGSSVSAPTGDKPQSKLWFADGIWWGAMYDTVSTDFHIYRLDTSTQTWSDTGTLVDPRVSAKIDAKWDGTNLYTVAHGQSAVSTADARFVRYSYDSATKKYTRDAGFPVVITPLGAEMVVIDKDTSGTLWATFTRDLKVYVAHTTTNDATWTAPYPLPVAGAQNLNVDDISTLVSYSGRIGVMWSNQTDWAYYFASHVDGAGDDAWTVTTAMKGAELADDHINIKSLEGDSAGRVFAAVKT